MLNVAKMKKYYCSWKSEWFIEEKFCGLVGIKTDKSRVECTFCKSTFAVKHGGKNDMTKHIELDSHKEKVLTKCVQF